MTSLNTELTTAQSFLLDEPISEQPTQQLDWLAAVVLRWRRDQLWVKSALTQPVNPLPALYNDEWLKQCLNHSPVWAVCLEPALNEATLERWSNIGEQVKKAVFLRSTSSLELPQKRNPVGWRLKRGLDWFVAACLLILLSPFLLLLAGCIQYGLGQPIFSKEWRVGYRGELFRIIKFRSLASDDSRFGVLGRWIQTYHLDELPQLVNVLQGEMSLVGPRPWTLSDAMQATSEAQKRLTALPGMIGAWQVHDHFCNVDLEAATQSDLQYLSTWSLAQDFKVLLLSLKFLSRPSVELK